jgi:hypothetical protein
MALSQDTLNSYVRGLYRFLEAGHTIELKKLRSLRGYIDNCDREAGYYVTVALDHRDRILSTLIHEYVHFRFPELCETEVLKLETQIMNSLSARRAKNLLKRLVAQL